MRARVGLTRVVAVALVSSTVLLGGCPPGKSARDEPPGVAQSDRKHAEGECARAAPTNSDSGQSLMPYVVDRDVYTKCMEARGYTTTTR